MAKKMRRVLAVLMALALCAGQLAIPAAAAETEEAILVPVEVTILEESPVTEQLATGEQLETNSTTTEWSEVTPEGAVIEGSETKT